MSIVVSFSLFVFPPKRAWASISLQVSSLACGDVSVHVSLFLLRCNASSCGLLLHLPRRCNTTVVSCFHLSQSLTHPLDAGATAPEGCNCTPPSPKPRDATPQKGVCLPVHRVSFSTTNANEDTSVGRQNCTSARATTVALLRLLAAFALLRAEEGGGRDVRGGHATVRASGSGTCARRRWKEKTVCHCSTSQVPTQHRHIRRVTQTSTCLDVDATREQEEG